MTCKISLKMLGKNVVKIFVALGCALAISGTQAASISFSPYYSASVKGGEITVDLLAGFDSMTILGGAVDLSWDASVLTFKDFVFDSGFGTPPRDAAFDVLDLQSSALLSLGFGNLDGMTVATNTIIGQVSFTLIGDYGSSSAITVGDSLKWGGFFDDTGVPILVSYTGATVTVIPEPASVWLFGLGIALLLGVAWRSKRKGLPAQAKLLIHCI